MTSAQTRTPAILKGPAFAERMDAVCRDPIDPQPLDGLKYEHVLLPSLWGGELLFGLLGTLAHAFRIRGSEATVLLCDQLLPACTAKKAFHRESACTRWCYRNAGPFAQAMRLPHRWHGEFITEAERVECRRLAGRVPVEEIPEFRWRDVDLGPNVLRSLECYLQVGQADLDDPAVRDEAYAFLTSAMFLTVVADRVLEQLEIDKVVLPDGMKNNWGVMRQVANRRGIPVDVIRFGLRGYSIRFERDRPPAPPALMGEWDTWRHAPLTPDQERWLDEYLARREKVPYEYRSAEWQTHIDDPQRVREQIGLPADVDGSVFAMFPNVSFDAGKTRTSAAAFDDAQAWVAETIERFRRWPEHRLLVKVHPAEHHRQATDRLIPYLQSRFDPWPTNVHLIPPDTDVTTHAVIRLIDCALVYTSTVGVEASVLGVPVILVGGGWNVGRGFTTDVATPQAYFELLDHMGETGELPPANVELARRYAYALFFRSNIPIEFYTVLNQDVTEIRYERLADLAPGNDPALDAVCRGVLLDEPFEAPEPTATTADRSHAPVEACALE